jgi:hypothetical protein
MIVVPSMYFRVSHARGWLLGISRTFAVLSVIFHAMQSLPYESRLVSVAKGIQYGG